MTMIQAFIQALLSTAFFAKDWVSLLFAKLTIFMRCSHGGHQNENFWIHGLQIVGKFISDTLLLTATAAAVMFLGFIESHEFYNPI